MFRFCYSNKKKAETGEEYNARKWWADKEGRLYYSYIFSKGVFIREKEGKS